MISQVLRRFQFLNIESCSFRLESHTLRVFAEETRNIMYKCSKIQPKLVILFTNAVKLSQYKARARICLLFRSPGIDSIQGIHSSSLCRLHCCTGYIGWRNRCLQSLPGLLKSFKFGLRLSRSLYFQQKRRSGPLISGSGKPIPVG